MNEAEYPGIRVSMQALFDGTITPLKSIYQQGCYNSGHSHSYKLMFEDRYIQLLVHRNCFQLRNWKRSYLQTHVCDFYDVYILKAYESEISNHLLQDALEATNKYKEVRS